LVNEALGNWELEWELKGSQNRGTGAGRVVPPRHPRTKMGPSWAECELESANVVDASLISSASTSMGAASGEN
jgi:hypothetical protein